MLNLVNRPTAVVAAILALAGCSDGDDAPPAVATVAGAAYKGPLASTSICVYKIDNAAVGKKGALVPAQTGSAPAVASGCVVTGNDGGYSLVLPADTTGELLVESKGGTYCSDESVYNGSTCAGGGTPVPMGSSVLRTVVAAPASGVIASAPLTILTTAAASGTGTLSVSTFNAAFGAVAANAGVTGTTPSTAPTAPAQNATLQALSNYLGGDASILADVLAGITSGAIKAVGGTVQTTKALTCSALDQNDSVNLYTLATCEPAGDGTYRRIQYDLGNNILDGTVRARNIYVQPGYTDAACNTNNDAPYQPVPYTVQYKGTAALALSASADATVSQSGSTSRLDMTVSPSSLFGNTTTTTISHQFCRTAAATGCNSSVKGYFTSTKSPVKNGSLSRVDGSVEYTGYCD